MCILYTRYCPGVTLQVKLFVLILHQLIRKQFCSKFKNLLYQLMLNIVNSYFINYTMTLNFILRFVLRGISRAWYYIIFDSHICFNKVTGFKSNVLLKCHFLNYLFNHRKVKTKHGVDGMIKYKITSVYIFYFAFVIIIKCWSIFFFHTKLEENMEAIVDLFRQEVVISIMATETTKKAK